MPNSLRCKLSKLRFQGKITQDEYKELIEKLEGHDEVLVAQIKWERDTAINQLQQLGYGLGEKVEPCVDCVSRKELLSRIDAERRHLLDIGMDGAEHIIVHHARRIIEDMPSVKPQRPKGRWIEQTDKNKKLYGWFYCSECGAVLGRVDGANYCSECGTEMEDSND